MIPESIKKLANKVRNEIYGRDVRESIAQSMEVSGETSNEANERSKDTAGRQTDVENRFDDQIAGNTDIDEVIDARRPEGGESYPTLRKRLDDEHKEVTAQLAQITYQLPESNGVDDTDMLKSIANDFTLSNSNKLLFKADETYYISDIIEFDLSSKRHVEFDFNGAKIILTDSFDYYKKGLFTLNFSRDIKSTVVIRNCFFDGSGNPPDFSIENNRPVGGRGAFFVNGATNVYMDNCYFSDLFYSACLWSHYASVVEVTNTTGERVGGRSTTNDDYDARGDALNFAYIGMGDPSSLEEVSITIDNCHFSSWEALDNPASNGNETYKNLSQSGRAGIVIGEFSNSEKIKNVKISNSYFYNYQRSLHLENVDKVSLIVENTTFEEYGGVLLLQKNENIDSFIFSNCNFIKTKNVMGMNRNYDCIVTSGPSGTKEVQGLIKNSLITGKGKIALLTNGINFVIEDSLLEVDLLSVTDYSVVTFKDSIIKFNRSEVHTSGFNFIRSTVEGGYLNNDLSSCFLEHSEYSTIDYDFIFKDSIFFNVLIDYPKSVIDIDTCRFEVDNNLKLINRRGITRKAFINNWDTIIRRINNSSFINKRTSQLNLFDNENGTRINSVLPINNSYFENVGIVISNTSSKYELSINNSIFKNIDGILSRFVSTYGSKALINNSMFYGEINQILHEFSGVVSNSYKIADDGTLTNIE